MQIPSAPPPGVSLTLQPVAQTSPAPSEGHTLSLQPHQVVRATVVQGGLDKAELELGRHRFQATTKVPLTTGQRIQAQVVSTSPFIQLRLVDQNALFRMFETLHLMRSSFDLGPILNRAALSQAFSGQGFAQQLRQVLGQAAESMPRDGTQLSGRMLQSLINLLGLDTERQVVQERPDQAAARLKSALLALTQDQGQNQEVRQRAERLLSHLELFQFCRVRLWDQGLNWIPLPLPFLEQGYMVWDREQEQREQDRDKEQARNYRLVLQLSHLGNMDIHLAHRQQGLRIGVGCAHHEVAAMVETWKQELMQRVTGIPVMEVLVSLQAEDPVQTLLSLAVPKGEQVFEARV